MVKNKLELFGIALFLILIIFFMGCSSGGSGGTEDENELSAVEVLPSEYDFGTVTLGNSPTPLEVKILNKSSRDLVVVSNIVLSDTDNFDLDVDGGSNPCNTSSPTISAGDFCSAEVFFQPLAEASYSANLRIETNDNQVLTSQLNGISESITNLKVSINQVESDLQCPTATITAYVSVTDQAGYTITGLLENNFLVSEDTTDKNIEDISFVSQVTAPISIALVMDYSGSIVGIPEALSDLEEAVAEFVNQLGDDDEAEIIKFATQIEVVQNFTSDKTLLLNAITKSVDIGVHTALYDAAYQAVNDTSLRLKERKAVIIVSDGEDDDGSGNPQSSNTLSDVISFANEKGVPIFTVGLGDLNEAILEQMANDTGGQYYASPTSDNLRNIYNQISDILFEDQYIIQYISALEVCETAVVTIQAESQTIIGDDTKEITPCCP